ncbi:MAG: hypothetical protein HOQ24_08810 [Mycobacteriaceae bacterium]|nr:hypothetical protein [Mycobacteriaceae bacterium]
MTDDLELRHRRLREAAIAVLNAAGDASDCPPEAASALAQLRHAVLGAVEDAPPEIGVADPAEHVVSRYKYQGKARFPVGLDEEAEGIRRQLAADRTVEAAGSTSDNVVLTELRGMIVGGLLRELAARLEPGAAFGPSAHGAALAAVVTDLSWELLDQTFVGRQ